MSSTTGVSRSEKSSLMRLGERARYHGYVGRFGTISYGLRFVGSYLMAWLAQQLPGLLVPTLHRARGVKVGRNVYIGEGVYIDHMYPEQVTIEDGVFLSPGSMVFTHMRDLKSYHRGMWIGNCSHIVKPVRIQRGVHIGIGCVILPGVTIGEGAIVGAGSVVTKDVTSYAVVAGNPAKPIRQIE